MTQREGTRYIEKGTSAIFYLVLAGFPPPFLSDGVVPVVFRLMKKARAHQFSHPVYTNFYLFIYTGFDVSCHSGTFAPSESCFARLHKAREANLLHLKFDRLLKSALAL